MCSVTTMSGKSAPASWFPAGADQVTVMNKTHLTVVGKAYYNDLPKAIITKKQTVPGPSVNPLGPVDLRRSHTSNGSPTVLVPSSFAGLGVVVSTAVMREYHEESKYDRSNAAMRGKGSLSSRLAYCTKIRATEWLKNQPGASVMRSKIRQRAATRKTAVYNTEIMKLREPVIMALARR